MMNLQKLRDEVNKLLTEFPPETEILFKPNVLGYRYEKTYSSIDMTRNRETVIGVLDQLQEALGLGRSESATERLFFILARAFDDLNVQEMENARQISHDEGLCYDMRVSMADRILQALEHDTEFGGLSR
jgi:hypothetical protein